MRRPSRWSLRQRLLAALLALAAAGLVVAGVLATVALRSSMMRGVDGQLAQASGLIWQASPRWLEPGGFPGPAAFYTEVTQNGTTRVVTQPLGSTPADLPALTTAQAEQTAGEPFTVDGWRAVAWPLPDGSGTVVIASSLATVHATVQQMALIEVAIGVFVLGALTAAGSVLVDRGLRPLTVVEATAAAIADGDLGRRVPVSDPATEVGALAVSFNTMLDRLQESFEAQTASEAAARASEERMRQFIADASHELRTPLTTIRGFAELRRMGALPDAARVDDAMRRIEEESARMALLVDDLLLLARLDAERALVAEPVDLDALARSAAAAAATAWPQRFEVHAGTGSTPTGAAERGYTVTGDADRLRQVLLNLLSNAARFNPAGAPIQLRVTATPTEVVLSVRDHGPGVPAHLQERIFHRFVRADGARARHDGGTGLGLSIVAAIVASHGGTVSAKDAPGGGALFEVRLPAQPP